MTLLECLAGRLTAVATLDLLNCRKERLLAFDLSALDSNHCCSSMTFVRCGLKWNENRIVVVFHFRGEIMTAPVIRFLFQKQICDVLRSSHTFCPDVESVLVFK